MQATKKGEDKKDGTGQVVGPKAEAEDAVRFRQTDQADQESPDGESSQ